MNAASPGLQDQRPVTAEEAATLFAGLSDEPAILVAVSGGPDSVALLSLLAEWAFAGDRPKLSAATVDHGLREESRAEAEGVAAICALLGVPHAILSWDGAKPATGIQSAARAARYRLLAGEALRLGHATLVTAHTLDDQAETLLMRMAHGSGPAGVAGMRARSRRDGVALTRPLLGIAKARLVATVRARGLSFIEDPGNADPRFERARWRKLMPQFATAGLSAARLGALASRLRRMDDAIEARANQLWPDVVAFGAAGHLRLDLARLLGEPDEIALRLVARAVTTMAPGGDGFLRLERLEACFEALRRAANGRVALKRTLSGCLLAMSRDGVLTVRPEPPRRRDVHPAT